MYSGILVSLSISPQFIGALADAGCLVLGGVPDNARVMGCTCGSSPSQFLAFGPALGYMPSNPLVSNHLFCPLMQCAAFLWAKTKESMN